MYRYQITVQPLEPERAGDQLSFTTDNHDDILAIARHLEGKLELGVDETHAFAVGLKLFGETVLRHRARAPFSQVRPAMAEFIKTLKAQVRGGE